MFLIWHWYKNSPLYDLLPKKRFLIWHFSSFCPPKRQKRSFLPLLHNVTKILHWIAKHRVKIITSIVFLARQPQWASSRTCNVVKFLPILPTRYVRTTLLGYLVASTTRSEGRNRWSASEHRVRKELMLYLYSASDGSRRVNTHVRYPMWVRAMLPKY